MLGVSVPGFVLVQGAVTGLGYGLLALGLVLVYRTNRVLNFAQGQLGVVAAVFLVKLNVDFGLDYWFALVLAIGLAAVMGGLSELVLRRLFDRPRVLVMVATLGLSQVLAVFTALPFIVPKNLSAPFPVPIHLTFTLDGYVFTPGEVLTLMVAPVVALALAAFVRLSPQGLAMRAVAENLDSARLSGIWARRTSTLTWVLAGVLSAFTAILASPGQTSSLTQVLSPDLMVFALTAALVGAMTSLTVAFVAGIAVGIVYEILIWNVSSTAAVQSVMFALLLVVLLARLSALRQSGRAGLGAGLAADADADADAPATLAAPRAPGARAAAPRAPGARAAAARAPAPAPEPVSRPRRDLRPLVGRTGVLAAVAAGALLPLILTPGNQFLMSQICLYAVIALSLTVLTGWAGQVSLGQFGLVAVGAVMAVHLGSSVPLVLLILYGGAVTAVVAVVVGLPALRVRGLYLAVSTLGFALWMQVGVLSTPCTNLPLVHRRVCLGLPSPTSTLIARPDLFGLGLGSERAFAWFSLGVLVASVLAVRVWRDHGVARRLVAVRDNEAGAAAMGIPVVRTKLLAFALSGFLAGGAGVCLAFATQRVSTDTFDPSVSIMVVSMVVIGGSGSIPGAVLGALYLLGLPAVFGTTSTIELLTSGSGLLVFLLYLPGGLAQVLHRAGDLAAAGLGRLGDRSGGSRPVAGSSRPAVPEVAAGGPGSLPTSAAGEVAR